MRTTQTNRPHTEHPAATGDPSPAAVRLLVGNLVAGIDELLRETSAPRRPLPPGSAARLSQVTLHLSLSELRTAGAHLRTALESFEFSQDLLNLHLLEAAQPSGDRPAGPPVLARN